MPRPWGMSRTSRNEPVTRRMTPEGVEPTKATLIDDCASIDEPTPVTQVRDLRTHDTPTGPADELGFDRPLFAPEEPLEGLPDTDKMRAAPPALQRAQRALEAAEQQAQPLPLPALPGLLDDEEDVETGVFESREGGASVGESTGRAAPTLDLRPAGRRSTPAMPLPAVAAASHAAPPALGERRTGPQPLADSPGRYRVRGKSGEVATPEPVRGSSPQIAPTRSSSPELPPVTVSFTPGLPAVARPAPSPAPQRLQASTAIRPTLRPTIEIPPPPEALFTVRPRSWTRWLWWLCLAIVLGLALGVAMGFAIKKWQRATPQSTPSHAGPRASGASQKRTRSGGPSHAGPRASGASQKRTRSGGPSHAGPRASGASQKRTR